MLPPCVCRSTVLMCGTVDPSPAFRRLRPGACLPYPLHAAPRFAGGRFPGFALSRGRPFVREYGNGSTGRAGQQRTPLGGKGEASATPAPGRERSLGRGTTFQVSKKPSTPAAPIEFRFSKPHGGAGQRPWIGLSFEDCLRDRRRRVRGELAKVVNLGAGRGDGVRERR
jgi:hypothetical protein